MGVTSENPLLLTQAIVDAPIVLIDVAAGAVAVCEVSGTATGQVRERKVLQKRYAVGSSRFGGMMLFRKGVLQTALVPLQAGFPPTPLVVAS